MGTLSTHKRNQLKNEDFGLPKQRKYPMPDKSHAINAKARATQMADKGYLSKSDEFKVKKKANKILKKATKKSK